MSANHPIDPVSIGKCNCREMERGTLSDILIGMAGAFEKGVVAFVPEWHVGDAGVQRIDPWTNRLVESLDSYIQESDPSSSFT